MVKNRNYLVVINLMGMENENKLIDILCQIPFYDWRKIIDHIDNNIDEAETDFKGKKITIEGFIRQSSHCFKIDTFLFTNEKIQNYINRLKSYIVSQEESKKLEEKIKINKAKQQLINSLLVTNGK